ncbi:MAG: NgoFVII family restriction endonuclease [Hydrococcus sp. SU_1_0]|nr:NgoFVII family restriction endonuclease [Hydrococcus sp. SU_1_0]
MVIFFTVLNSEFKAAINVTIASGYASLDIINAFNSEFIRIANAGGNSRLLLGMAFYEGLSQKKYDALIKLNSELKSYGNNSGVYVTNGRRYHGKVYYFEQKSKAEYPKGDFTAYTDDGYVIPMRTQGDNCKNIRSKDSLQIFGMWLKGKLERSGSLKQYEPVTQDTLTEYGSNELIFYKIDEGKYYLEF